VTPKKSTRSAVLYSALILFNIHFGMKGHASFKLFCIMTFAESVIRFFEQLRYTGAILPDHIRVLNPYRASAETMRVVREFYTKYYSDDDKRHLILGINPGRFGAGHTGIPFTDPKRLKTECGIDFNGKVTHEPSSVFVYEVIRAMGGPASFYKRFYISSLCPLGFVSVDAVGKEKNLNYYDTPELLNATRSYIVENIRTQIGLGVSTDVCFCFGTGKNERMLSSLNEDYRFFGRIVALEHPRFIMQYRNPQMRHYIDKYIAAFGR